MFFPPLWKRNNFWNFQFAFLDEEALQNGVYFLKKRIGSKGSYFPGRAEIQKHALRQKVKNAVDF